MENYLKILIVCGWWNIYFNISVINKQYNLSQIIINDSFMNDRLMFHLFDNMPNRIFVHIYIILTFTLIILYSIEYNNKAYLPPPR